jgi:uncharacterized protein YfaS (alpha-2-macroglobulin family)
MRPILVCTVLALTLAFVAAAPAAAAPTRDVEEITGFSLDATQVRLSLTGRQLDLLAPFVCSARCTGQFTVTLRSLGGAVLGRREAPVPPLRGTEGALRLGLPVTASEPLLETAVLEVAYTSAGERLAHRIAAARVLDGPRLRLLGQETLRAGSRPSLRVLVHRQRSRDPLVGAEVEVSLAGPALPRRTISGRTGASGTFAPVLDVPAAAAGKTLRLTVLARTVAGERRLETDVQVKVPVRLLLVTDKPIYQPGQTLHLRALALRHPGGGAVADVPATFEVRDGRGNLVFRHTARTSAHGIGHARLTLADQVNQGRYRLSVRLDVPGGQGHVAEKTVRVFTYRLPRIKIRTRLDRPYYRPGEEVTGEVYVWYVWGRPAESAEVVLEADTILPDRRRFARVSGRASRHGAVPFRLRLPDALAGSALDQGNARVLLRITAREPGGEERAAEASVPVVRHPIRVGFVPERDRPVPGTPQRVWIMTTLPDGAPAASRVSLTLSPAGRLALAPEPGRLAFAGPRQLTVDTDAQGIGAIWITPGAARYGLDASARDAAGRTGEARLDLSGPRGATAVILRPDRALYRVGEQVSLEVIAPETQGYAYLDVVRAGQTVSTHEVRLEEGRGHLALPLGPDHAGTILVSATVLDAAGEPVRDVRPLLVEEARALRVRVTADRKEYAPGQDAHLQVQVTDAEGRPVQAALGVWIVDQAVYHLAESQPGLAEVFFRLEEELLRPRWSVPGLAPGGLVLPATEAEARRRQSRAAEVLLAAAAATRPHSLEITDAARHDADLRRRIRVAARPRVQAILERVARAVAAYLASPKRECEEPSLESLERARLLGPGALRDPWGTDVDVSLSLDNRRRIEVTVTSRGPDEEQGGDDDLALTQTVVVARCLVRGSLQDVLGFSAHPGGPSGRGDLLRSGRAGGAGGIPRASPLASPGAAPARVRSFFPEALLIQPELLTDGQGRVTLPVRMADSITTWRLSALASTTDGRLGSVEADLRVLTPFFADVTLPPELTRGDRITVPVALHNYQRTPETVQVTLQGAPWYRLAAGAATQTATLAPGEVRSVPFSVEVREVGTFPLRVTARGRAVSDAVERSVTVRPDGDPVDHVVSDGLEAPATVTVEVPSGIVPGSARLRVEVMPGALAAVVDGLESLLRIPSGCFEQTSSTTYPNVLVLQYLQTTRRLSPELAARARFLVGQGYQRLVTYEVRGGGFSLFGDAPADVALTAYGLQEFVDMATVFPVDAGLLARTRAFLLSSQRADGSFPPTPSYFFDAPSTLRDRVRVTAYTAWSLRRAGVTGAPLARALAYVVRHLAAATDAYTLAVVASALAATHPGDPRLTAVLGRLPAPQAEGARALRYAVKGAETMMHSRGRAADVETAALLASALLAAGRDLPRTRRLLAFLAQSKSARGGWDSTQANVLALRALVDAARRSGAADAQGGVEITLDGQPAGTVTLGPTNAGVVHTVDLGARVRPGARHVVTLAWKGTGLPMYQVRSGHHLPYGRLQRPPEETSGLRLDVRYDRRELTTADAVTVHVRLHNPTPKRAVMPLIDLGVPAGFDVETADLDALVTRSVIARYDRFARQVALYLTHLAPGGTVELRYRLRARLPLRVTAPPSSAYEYYTDQVRTHAPSQLLTVR